MLKRRLVAVGALVSICALLVVAIFHAHLKARLVAKFSYQVNFSDPSGAFGGARNAIISAMSAALDEYARYVKGTSVPVQVSIEVNQLQNAQAPAYILDQTFQTISGGNAIQQSRLVAMLTTGTDPGYFPNRPTPNSPAQLTIKLNPNFFSLFAAVGANDPIPEGKFDATSEFIGLIGQALGVNTGLAFQVGSNSFQQIKDGAGNNVVQQMDPYMQVIGGKPYFVGSFAKAANNGQPIELGHINTRTNFYFLGDLAADDVFNIVGDNNQFTFLQPGKHYKLSALDLGILRDVAPGLQISVPQIGTSANDVFRSAINIADDYDGLTGRDTAVYTGIRSAYTTTLAADGTITVTSKADPTDVDTFTNVERIHFADGVLIFDGGANASPAYRLYQAAFARVPDEGGLLVQAHLAFDVLVPQKAAAGASTADKVAGFTISTAQYLADIDVAGRFLSTPEFIARYGANVSDGQFVDLLYQNVLGRLPDDAGRAVQVAALQAGLTRATLLANFAESAENVALTAPNTTVGLWSTVPDPAYG